MKKFTLFFSALILLAASCQPKDEPKGPPQPQQQQYTGQQTPMVNMQMDQEIRILEGAVKSDPKNVGAWIKLGNIFMDSARFNEAVNAYGKALEIDARNVDVRVDLGTCYRNSGRADKAVEEYRKALKINPNHLNGRKNLGVVLAFDLKDKQNAIKEFEKYLQLAPNAPDAAQVKQEIENLKIK